MYGSLAFPVLCGALLSPTGICFPQRVVGVFVHLGQWGLRHGSGEANTYAQRGGWSIGIAVWGEKAGQDGGERGEPPEQLSPPHQPPLTPHFYTQAHTVIQPHV